jgi:hypothetical protein
MIFAKETIAAPRDAKIGPRRLGAPNGPWSELNVVQVSPASLIRPGRAAFLEVKSVRGSPSENQRDIRLLVISSRYSRRGRPREGRRVRVRDSRVSTPHGRQHLPDIISKARTEAIEVLKRRKSYADSEGAA